MREYLDNLEYGKRWHDIHIDYYESYFPNMADFHMHDYYEISLILSGNVKVLLPDCAQSGEDSCMVLTRPGTLHYIACEGDILYRRLNLLFSKEFVEDYLPESKELLNVFGKNGTVIVLSLERCAEYRDTIEKIKAEKSLFRQRLMLLCFFSRIAELESGYVAAENDIPLYIAGALSYIGTHYKEKILAAELAWHLGIGRTTLMTAFKKYTGTTLNDYVNQYRLKNALWMLKSGKTEQEIAEACGFCNACGFIRSFKRFYGMPPRRYLVHQRKG